MSIIGGDIISQITGGVFKTGDVPAPDYTGDSPAVVIATYIVEQNVMSTPSAVATWPLYVSTLPESDQVERNAGAVFDTGPIKDGRLMAGSVVEHFGVMFHIRSINSRAGWGKINQVATAIDAIDNTVITVDSIDYEINNVTRIGGINSLGLLPGTIREYLFTLNLIFPLKQV